MKHWNYRVIEFAANQNEPARRELREVYYDDTDRPCAYGAAAQVMWDVEEDPATPYSILERMREALNKPALDAREFEPEKPTVAQPEVVPASIILEKIPNSEDLLLPLPDSLLTDQDWRIGDRLRFEVLAEGHFALTNVSKAERES
jgi:hypothetical protein